MKSFDGVIVVNKPQNWTSHDVVAKMRGIAGTRRVGHLGTLDPIATGVLPVMIGQATRLAQFWDKSEKAYETIIHLGFATTTYDREGEPLGPDTSPVITAEQIEACLTTTRGEINQVPPPVSAKKINGVPAYKLARQNIPVELKAVRVTIYELTLVTLEGPKATLRVRCSPGTYIRTIAHELGIKLGCGAHVEQLTRTKSGPFALNQAQSLERLQFLKDVSQLDTVLISPPDLLPNIPAVQVDDTTTARIRQGRDFAVSPFRQNPDSEHIKAIGPEGTLVAIGKIALPHVYHPVVVLA